MKIKINMGGDLVNVDAGVETSEIGGGSHHKSSIQLKTSINQSGMSWPNVSGKDIIRFLDISKWKASYEVDGDIPPSSPPEPPPEPKEEEKEEEEIPL